MESPQTPCHSHASDGGGETSTVRAFLHIHPSLLNKKSPIIHYLFFPVTLRLMLGFMSITAFISMWISNIASTAIMLQIVRAVLEHLSRIEAEDEEREVQQSRTIRSKIQGSKDGTGNIRM